MRELQRVIFLSVSHFVSIVTIFSPKNYIRPFFFFKFHLLALFLFHLLHNSQLFGLTPVIPPLSASLPASPYLVFAIWYDSEAFAETTGVCQSGRRTEEEEQHKRLRVYRRKCNAAKLTAQVEHSHYFPPVLFLTALHWHCVLTFPKK